MADSTKHLDPVYDEEDESVPATDLKKKENAPDTPAELLERIPAMSSEEDAARQTSSAGASTEAPGPSSLYRGNKHEKQGFIGRLNGSRNMKKYLIAGGLGAALIAIAILLFSFLNVFKLDGLMSSIEQRAFLRTNATLDTRSTKWMSAYVEARMLDMGDNPNFDNPDFQKNDNLLFRANRVDNNRPFTDWYRTLRTSKFEQEVFEKHGIKFTSIVTAEGKFRPGKIDINGEKPITFNVADINATDFNALSRGDIPAIQRFGNIVDAKAFSGNKEARAEIKKVVNENTRNYEVWKRRALRKDIQNMTGVKDWRFFETSRDKLAQKRIDVRIKIVDKMVPDTNLLGQVTRCLFGVSVCKPNRDVAAPQNKFTTAELAGAEKPDTNTKEENKTEAAISAKTASNLDAAGISDLLKKILTQANIFARILNIPSTLDMLSNINKSVSSLVKFIVIARGAEAAGLFQVFETSRDQLKTGQVTSTEVNDLMKVVDTAGSSDAQVKVIDGKGDPGVASTDERCSQKARALHEKDPGAYDKQYGPYAPLCADQRIGSADNGQAIQDAYNSSLGPLVGPIVGAWSGIKSIPLIGLGIDLITKFSNLINDITSAILKEVLSVLGLQDNLQQAMTWIFGKISTFLGLSIINGHELPGTMYNWLVQGGAYTAESASRQQGAAITNTASLKATQNTVAMYQREKKADSSLYDKVASLSNPDSVAYKGAFALSNFKSDPGAGFASGLQNVWTGMAKNFGMVFGRSTLAASPSGYTASKFAGIETYDYPQQCYDLDPATATPQQGTNIQQVLGAAKVPTSELTWDLVTNSDNFYTYLYDKIGDIDNADDIAIHVYNCNLLDTAVRGSLGYLYGYTKDNADLAQ